VKECSATLQLHLGIHQSNCTFWCLCELGLTWLVTMGRLCTREETPIQFHERDVLSAYRVNFTFFETVRSIFQLHNETVNIFSHLVPAIYFAYLWVSILPFSITPTAQPTYTNTKKHVQFFDGNRWFSGSVGFGARDTSYNEDGLYHVGATFVLNVFFSAVVGCFTASSVAHTFCNYSPSVRDLCWAVRIMLFSSHCALL
jgi:hypothetical protein